MSLTDPMLFAASEALREHPDHLRWLSYADTELARLRDLCGLATPTGYAQGKPNYPPEPAHEDAEAAHALLTQAGVPTHCDAGQPLSLALRVSVLADAATTPTTEG